MRRPHVLFIALAAAFALAGTSTAQAADPIEGVWKYGDGAVSVAAQTDGSFTGTVVQPITFSSCPHAAGEQMWIQVRPQPDGQYFGEHQWFNTTTCTPIERGHTAYRILTKPDGSRFLRVCFASPGSGLQPSIDPAGADTNATDGCNDSDFIAPLAKPKFDAVVKLPTTKRCVSRRSFKIRLREPKNDKLASATVYLNGKKIKAVKGARLTAPINLKGLPKGRYTVKIVATTVTGRTIKGTRKYRTCAKARRGSGKHRV